MAAEPQEQEGASLRRLLLILRRRWRLLALVWLAATAATAVYTWSTPRLYRPQSTIEIRPETPVVSGTSEDPLLLAGRLMWENYYRTQEAILSSPAIVDATFKALPEAVRRELESGPDPLKEFLKKLEIEKVRNSFILKVGFVDRDGEKAAQVVNTLVSVYLEDANRRHRDVKATAAEALTKEALPDIRKRVDAADQAMQAFQAANGFIDSEERHRSLVEDWRKVNARLSDRRLTRLRLRAEATALGTYRADGVAGLFHPIFHQTRALEKMMEQRARIVEELAKESRTLKEMHPRVRQLRQELAAMEKEILDAVAGTLTALETDLKSAEQEEAALAAEQKRLESEISEAGRKLAAYRRLEADLAAAKELYASYLKKHGDVTATSGGGLASVRVVDFAREPREAYKPRVFMNLALGSVVGLALGVAAMLLTDQLDNRIRSAEEIEAFVGLEVLGVIPRLAEASGERPVLLEKESSLAEFEAFRGLRAAVVTRLERVPGGRVLAVLSPMQGEGKTTVTVNLAKVLAMEGRRVLVFDADMRRPAMRQFVSKDGPGLEKVLSGESTLDQAVSSSAVPGVDVVGAREGTTGAAELASSPRFAAAIAEARSKYDFVLIDSAPVIPAAESAQIARRADAALLVVREAQTRRGVAQLAKRRLEGMGVRVLGAVLNCAVPHGGAYGYGYGYYYSSYYTRGSAAPAP